MAYSSSLEDEIQKIEQKVKDSLLPTGLRERIEEELETVKRGLKVGGSFAGFETLSNYVDWVVPLPFSQETKDVLNLKNVKEVLDKNHYGLNTVKDRILEYLSSLILISQNKSFNNSINAPILCLVGLVGTGKTTLASSVAKAMGRKFERIPFGGMNGAQLLRGQSRTIPDSEPGFIIKSLVKATSRNPVILLDELDRVTEEGRSDIMGVLVEVLDSEQNKTYVDHYIDYPFDLSRVLFIATANNTTNIPTAVLDRLETIQMPSYTDEEKIIIARDYLFPKIRFHSGLSEKHINIADALWPIIVRPLGFDSGMRSLERTIEAVCRKVARMVVEGKSQNVAITIENVKEFLTS